MVSVVYCLVRLSVGLIVEKIRDDAARQLKDSDVTDEEVRQVVLRELDDIKYKLDGLARKDLLSSVSSFKEGMELLFLSLRNVHGDGETDDANDQGQGKTRPLTLRDINVDDRGDSASMLGASCCKSGQMSDFDLIARIKNLDSISRRRFEEARTAFQEARNEAKRAFSNASLSMEDRILAIKLRIMSRILESLEDVQAAAVSCKLYLEELHAMPAVRETLSVYLNGGVMAWFNKDKRTETVTSVALINYVVFNFTEMFAKETMRLADWPRIRLPGKSLHPIVNLEIKAMMKKYEMPMCEMRSIRLSEPTCVDRPYASFVRAPLSDFVLFPNENNSVLTVTSNNEFVVTEPGNQMDDRIKLFNGNGELEKAFFINDDDYEQKKLIFKPQGLATDGKGNIYAIATDKYYNLAHVLSAFDNCGRKTREFPIERAFYIAVNKEGDKAFVPKSFNGNWRLSDRLYIYDINRGKLERSFDYKTETLTGAIAVSDAGLIFLADEVNHELHVYTEKGHQVQQFNISPRMLSISFNSLSREIVVCSCKDGKTLLLNSYSEGGDRLGTLPLTEMTFSTPPAVSVTPDGRIVLTHGGKVHLI